MADPLAPRRRDASEAAWAAAEAEADAKFAHFQRVWTTLVSVGVVAVTAALLRGCG